jgi:hypothetical protein
MRRIALYTLLVRPHRADSSHGADVGDPGGSRRAAVSRHPDRAARTPVSLDYDVPFKFTGRIEKVTVELK